MVNQIAHSVSVHRISEAHLGFDLVTLCDRDFAHVVAEARDLQMLRVVPCARRTQPGCEFVGDIFVLPESDDYLPPHASAAGEKSKLAIAVCRLIQIHEVHVDRRPWQLAVELRVQMHKRLAECSQSLDPHFCRRECMHPHDEANTVC